MPKRFTLFALWAVFAAAAVGVGFGASGLVGQPFTAGGPSATEVGTSEVSVTTPSVSASPTGAASTAASVVRGQNTRGGYVSATCVGRLAQVSASPATGWEVASRTKGSARAARVRFEPVSDGHGERVTVTVRCTSTGPVFQRRDRGPEVADDHGGSTGGGGASTPAGGGDDHGGGSGGGGGGGGDDHGGGSGGDSGGGDD